MGVKRSAGGRDEAVAAPAAPVAGRPTRVRVVRLLASGILAAGAIACGAGEEGPGPAGAGSAVEERAVENPAVEGSAVEGSAVEGPTAGGERPPGTPMDAPADVPGAEAPVGAEALDGGRGEGGEGDRADEAAAEGGPGAAGDPAAIGDAATGGDSATVDGAGAAGAAAGDPARADPDVAGRDASETASAAASSTASAEAPEGPTPEEALIASPPSFQRPERIRGIYLNAWASGSRARTEALIELARRTEINTFVIDVKDDTGFMSYRTGVELAKEIGADGELRILNLERLLRRLEEEGIYPIARIVVFKDHLLAEQRPDMAIQDSAGGAWVDGRGDVWVNPYDERVWAYHVDIAREAVALGFPEIQWDYVRFPDRPQSELERAVFPWRGERTRSQAIRDFLVWSGEELAEVGVPLTADVFGMATSARTDVGIGQLWEDFIDVIDVALPMIYPSHYWAGSFGIEEPNAHPYETIHAALRHAVRRNEAIENPGRIIPWLQDFTLGPPRYEAAEVRAQILATYDVGIEEWILWNSAGRYTEAALEPVGGWAEGEEPLIRFGGDVVPAAVRLLPAEEGGEASGGGGADRDAAADTSSRVGGGSTR